MYQNKLIEWKIIKNRTVTHSATELIEWKMIKDRTH
jgi:hypothetical protein